jgi:hypothetical protein
MRLVLTRLIRPAIGLSAKAGYGKRARVETAIGNPSSGGVCGLGRFTLSRRKSPSAALSSTA